MFGIKQGDDSARAAKAREVRAWVRERFAVADDATVMVTELACPEPGGRATLGAGGRGLPGHACRHGHLMRKDLDRVRSLRSLRARG